MNRAGSASESRGRSRSADLSDVRWLARKVLPLERNGLAAEVPTPRLVSASARSSGDIRNYVSWWAHHPSPGSTFESRTWWRRAMPSALVVRALTALRYDGLIYVTNGTVVGHVFFQKHQSALHGFSTAVHDGFEGGGHSVVMMLDFVAYAAGTPGITAARVGKGENNTTRRLLSRLRAHAETLDWRVEADGWVTFPAEAVAAPGRQTSAHEQDS
jgi:hypothetical protein